MNEIKFNSVGKTKNNLADLFHLLLNYDTIRKKDFSIKCLEKLQPTFPDSTLYLTHSATGALEMIAQCIGIQPGDEIILPSFTFVSTANAFVNYGAIPRFVDCDDEFLNISVDRIEEKISKRTKAIVAMHYMGHACEMEKLKAICKKYSLFLIEDAATGYGNTYEGKALGSVGDFGVISFDSTKHISAIQGGLLIVNNHAFVKRFNNIYHIGTNRINFEMGEVQQYDWVDVGSKYQLNELNAAFLFSQLEQQEEIFSLRKNLSNKYDALLRPLTLSNQFKIMSQELINSNIHGYYILFKSNHLRNLVQKDLMENGIEAFSHYTPLHLSPKGKEFSGNDTCPISANIAETILRLPMHNDLTVKDIDFICKSIQKAIFKYD